MLEYSVSFPVRYYETDQMGIVHHSNYIRYFECARSAMMEEWGYPIQKCEEEGVTIPIVSVECHYKHSALMGDVVRCVAAVDKVPMAKMVIHQAVYNQNGDLCAYGDVTLGFLNKATGLPTRCPEKIVEIISNGLKNK
ncbi:MAG: acyl-CoA thioesterase [Bacteroidales bacterium]|nr:acyl-CoA thioesterase [Bacteroidales bacterium]MDD6052590.1 acyl-CoA thioesterase [Bacteroidales bacterium]